MPIAPLAHSKERGVIAGPGSRRDTLDTVDLGCPLSGQPAGDPVLRTNDLVKSSSCVYM